MGWDGMRCPSVPSRSFHSDSSAYIEGHFCIYEWVIGGRAPIVSSFSVLIPGQRASKQGATDGTDFPNRDTRGRRRLTEPLGPVRPSGLEESHGRYIARDMTNDVTNVWMMKCFLTTIVYFFW